MARKRKARKASKKLLPLGKCYKIKGKCFKIGKKAGKRVRKTCRCTSTTPSRTQIKSSR